MSCRALVDLAASQLRLNRQVRVELNASLTNDHVLVCLTRGQVWWRQGSDDAQACRGGRGGTDSFCNVPGYRASFCSSAKPSSSIARGRILAAFL